MFNTSDGIYEHGEQYDTEALVFTSQYKVNTPTLIVTKTNIRNYRTQF
jgi:hypothetical protein